MAQRRKEPFNVSQVSPEAVKASPEALKEDKAIQTAVVEEKVNKPIRIIKLDENTIRIDF